jgi:hypothetical protein
MQADIKTISQSALSTNLTSVYTVPASTTTLVKEILVCNTSANATKYTIYFVENGDTEGVKNAVFYGLTLLGNETQAIGLSTSLNAQCSIKVKADIDGVLGMTISGVELS